MGRVTEAWSGLARERIPDSHAKVSEEASRTRVGPVQIMGPSAKSGVNSIEWSRHLIDREITK